MALVTAWAVVLVAVRVAARIEAASMIGAGRHRRLG